MLFGHLVFPMFIVILTTNILVFFIYNFLHILSVIMKFSWNCWGIHLHYTLIAIHSNMSSTVFLSFILYMYFYKYIVFLMFIYLYMVITFLLCSDIFNSYLSSISVPFSDGHIWFILQLCYNPSFAFHLPPRSTSSSLSVFTISLILLRIICS